METNIGVKMVVSARAAASLGVSEFLPVVTSLPLPA
jgi:hypothetical protein